MFVFVFREKICFIKIFVFFHTFSCFSFMVYLWYVVSLRRKAELLNVLCWFILCIGLCECLDLCVCVWRVCTYASKGAFQSVGIPVWRCECSSKFFMFFRVLCNYFYIRMYLCVLIYVCFYGFSFFHIKGIFSYKYDLCSYRLILRFNHSCLLNFCSARYFKW